jgi:hypothetical protein
MNRDNAKLHRELKIAEAKIKQQVAQHVEEQKQLRFEVQNKQSEAARLQAAQSQLLDPSARERIGELTAQLAQEQEKHHQEVSGLKYELDKLRMVRVELSMRKEDATQQGRESLRLTLESLQEKYNDLKQKAERESKDLHAKLVWYIENQPLIATLEAQLRSKQSEIESLRDENLMMNHLLPPGARSEVTGKEIKLKPRPQDTKRIKELEVKVADLTDIVRKKSAPQALANEAATKATGGASGTGAIVGASKAGGATAASGPLAGMIAAIKPSMEENELIRSLRARVAELEASLQASDEGSEAALRSLRQESDQVKLLWERRVAKLQKEVEDTRKRIPLTGRNKLNRVAELERQLNDTRRFFTDKTRRLQQILVKVRRGEKVDEGDLREAEEEAARDLADDKENKQQQQQSSSSSASQQPQQQSKGDETSSANANTVTGSTPANAHDSLPLPSRSAHNMSVEGDLPRSPLRVGAHAHPPHPHSHLFGGVSSSSEVLHLKQSLTEAHARELHLLSSKYEQQVEGMKTSWESQVHLLRATAAADAKLAQSLLQQARDECVHVRQTLSSEMGQRSLLQARCLELESDLVRARSEGGYVDYHKLQHHLELITLKFEQQCRSYEEAAKLSKDDMRVERAHWEEQIRAKNHQLNHAKARFQQLTNTLRQMQQQQQQQQMQLQQQHHFHPAAVASRPAHASPSSLAVFATAAAPGAFSPEGVSSPARPGSGARAANEDDDDDIAQLISTHRVSVTRHAPPPPPPVNEEAMQLQWSYLNGGAPPPPPQPTSSATPTPNEQLQSPSQQSRHQQHRVSASPPRSHSRRSAEWAAEREPAVRQPAARARA